MSEKTVAEKLLIKPGKKVLFVNALQNLADLLGSLPAGVIMLNEPGEPADIILAFIKNRQELETQLANLKAALDPKGALWITYYKGTARIKTDIHRDSINAYAKTLGLTGVMMISVDQDWSALRLKIT